MTLRSNIRRSFPEFRQRNLRTVPLLAQLGGSHELEDLYRLRDIDRRTAGVEELSDRLNEGIGSSPART